MKTLSDNSMILFLPEIWASISKKFYMDDLTLGYRPKIIHRDWKQRLFSWPWCPWKSHNVIWPDIEKEPNPKDKVIIRHKPL